MNWIEGFITALISSSVISGVIIHFGKYWITKKLDYVYAAKLEIHKSEMKAVSDTELEKLKSSLTIEANKHSVVFSNLHDKRAEILAITYQLLVETHNALEAYTSPIEFIGGDTQESRRKAMGLSIDKFTNYYSSHAIYLPESIVSGLKNIDSKMTKTGMSFMTNIEMTEKSNPEGWKVIVEEVGELSKTAMKSIEQEFRTILAGKNI